MGKSLFDVIGNILNRVEGLTPEGHRRRSEYIKASGELRGKLAKDGFVEITREFGDGLVRNGIDVQLALTGLDHEDKPELRMWAPLGPVLLARCKVWGEGLGEYELRWAPGEIIKALLRKYKTDPTIQANCQTETSTAAFVETLMKRQGWFWDEGRANWRRHGEQEKKPVEPNPELTNAREKETLGSEPNLKGELK